MLPIPAMLALVLVIPLLYIPGLMIANALNQHPNPELLERVYERMLMGTLLNGWLTFTLAELGIFSLWLHVLLVALICLVAWQWGRGEHNDNMRLQSSTAPHRSRLDAPSLALLLILGLFLVLVARPFEVVLGVRDAGVYANAGFAIARTGGIVQYDDIVAGIGRDQQSDDPALRDAAAQAETNLLGVQPRQRNIATRLRAAGFLINDGDLAAGRVVPQGFHLFPAWIGLLTALGGMQFGLFATGLLGMLGLWSTAMLARRLAGPWAGVAAALLLALNGTQLWFARYSTAEAIAQFLIFAGLYTFSLLLPLTTQSSKLKAQNSYTALLCGLAFGQLALTRIDFVLVLAPLLAYLLYTWLRRRWQRAHSWLMAGLGAMLLQAALHIALIARAYFFDTMFADLQLRALTALAALPFLTPKLRDVYLLRPCSKIGITPCPPVAGMPAQTEFLGWNIARISMEVALLILGLLTLWALYRYGQGLMARIEAILQRLSHLLLPLAALGLAFVLAYAYLIRPQIVDSATLAALPSCLSPTQMRSPTAACLKLQGYVGAPIAAPAYADPLAAAFEQLKLRLRGRNVPSLSACIAIRSELLPPAANGRTSVELRRDGLVSENVIGAQNWATLQACDYVVLRDLFANSQANLVRVGWYLSPLGIGLGALGLVLLTVRMQREAAVASWLFVCVALINLYFFGKQTYGTSDQHYIYILRRYVPVVYPALCVAMAYVLTRGWKSGNKRARDGVPLASRPIHHSNFKPFLSLALLLALTLFNLFTNQKIYTHTEYATALQQLGLIAQRFGPNDVLLLRGGAPGSARDIPDNLATPLTYAYGLNALTVKSDQPAKYADQLARYVEQWHTEGRQVYMLLSASGALDLPGYTLQSQGKAEIRLREFEQPTSQKPTNIQDFSLDFHIYKLVPAAERQELGQIAVDDYARQVLGFYRAEHDATSGRLIAWTNGGALLRIPRPTHNQPITIQLELAAGTTRPAALGPVQACLDYRIEQRPWADDPQAAPFAPQQCYAITAEPHSYTLQIEPGSYANLPGDSLLIRIQSDTWLPARDDPQQHDRRVLGLQFLGAVIATVVQSPGN